jgi:alpha,alpha-trehalase
MLYRDLRAACESGWDFSSRWLRKGDDLSTIQTTQIIPSDLNALLYLLEQCISRAHDANNDQSGREKFEELCQNRIDAMNETLWNAEEGYFGDLNFKTNTFATPSLAMMFPLFAGIATTKQAERTILFVRDHFLWPGGWVTTTNNTGQQWDAPNGWAPLQWITYIGLKNYGFTELAKEGALRWLKLNEDVFKRTGRMMEKYNVEDLSLDAGGGEYPVQDGFGWTNGVYLALSKELSKST